MTMRAFTYLLLMTGALWAAKPALTFYNQNFAVVRDTVALNLHKGESRVTYGEITAHLEPHCFV